MVITGEDLRAIFNVIVIFLGFATIHSALTFYFVKSLGVKIFGAEIIKGFYRLFYTGISLVSTVGAFYLIHRIPDRVLFQAPSGLAVVMHSVQVMGLILGIVAFRRFNGLEFLGIKQAINYLKRQKVNGDIEGISETGLITDGVYAYIRHPMYLAGILIFSFEPNITRNFLTVSIMADIYFIYGALREDRILERKFPQFKQYKETVPFMIPSLRKLLGKVANNGSS